MKNKTIGSEPLCSNLEHEYLADQLGRSEGNQSTIFNLYRQLPKDSNWNLTSVCNKECSDIKNCIQHLFLLRNPFSSLHNVKLGTLLRQFEIYGQSRAKLFLSSWFNYDWIDQNVMETMKFAFHAAQFKDFLILQEKMEKTNITFTWNIPSFSSDMVTIFNWLQCFAFLISYN